MNEQIYQRYKKLLSTNTLPVCFRKPLEAAVKEYESKNKKDSKK
jgi:hypothetical protein